MELVFTAIFLCVVFLVFFLLAWGIMHLVSKMLGKLVDMFINFWTSGE